MWHPGEEGRSSLHLSRSKDSSIFTMVLLFPFLFFFKNRIYISLIRSCCHNSWFYEKYKKGHRQSFQKSETQSSEKHIIYNCIRMLLCRFFSMWVHADMSECVAQNIILITGKNMSNKILNEMKKTQTECG